MLRNILKFKDRFGDGLYEKYFVTIMDVAINFRVSIHYYLRGQKRFPIFFTMFQMMNLNAS